jgi:hypothetical protein
MNEFINKILKYILIGIITGLSLRYIPENPIPQQDILMVSFIISIGYAILDRILPSIYFENKSNDKSDI